MFEFTIGDVEAFGRETGRTSVKLTLYGEEDGEAPEEPVHRSVPGKEEARTTTPGTPHISPYDQRRPERSNGQVQESRHVHGDHTNSVRRRNGVVTYLARMKLAWTMIVTARQDRAVRL